MIRILPFCLLLLPLLLLALIPLTRKTGRRELVVTLNRALARSYGGLVSCSGKLFLMGGSGGPMPVEMLDPGRDNEEPVWIRKSIAPLVLHHFQAVGLQDRIYVAAGELFTYEPAADWWGQTIAISPERRRTGTGMAVYEGRLYLAGGVQDEMMTEGDAVVSGVARTKRFFDEYDPETEQWRKLPDMPRGKGYCHAAVVKDRFYVVGRRSKEGAWSGELDCFDFARGRWLPAMDLPVAGRSRSSGGTYDADPGSGETEGGVLANLDDKLYYIHTMGIWLFHPEAGKTWQRKEEMISPRSPLSAAVLDHAIYIAGAEEVPEPLTAAPCLVERYRLL